VSQVRTRARGVLSKGSLALALNQNGITNAAIYSSDYCQYDFSSSQRLLGVRGKF
jgi:hypothetical protein